MLIADLSYIDELGWFAYVTTKGASGQWSRTPKTGYVETQRALRQLVRHTWGDGVHCRIVTAHVILERET